MVAADAFGCLLRDPCHPRQRKRGDHAAKRSGGVERSETVSGGEQPTLGGRITKKESDL